MAAKKARFLKILVVDDILYVVKSISKVLSAEGFFVFTARTGLEALNKFREYSPNLVTIDQKLPDMTGRQLVQMLRAVDKERNTKTNMIFISAVDDREEIKSIMQLGIDDYLVKPFKKGRLLETVKQLIGTPRGTEDGKTAGTEDANPAAGGPDDDLDMEIEISDDMTDTGDAARGTEDYASEDEPPAARGTEDDTEHESPAEDEPQGLV